MNQYEQIEKDIQERISKVIVDQKAWSEIKGSDVSNTKGQIKPYGMITELDYYTWPGCYPLYYITKDCAALCPRCANENIGLLSDPYDPQWYVIGYAINYEDDSLYCDHCGRRIESAYEEDE